MLTEVPDVLCMVELTFNLEYSESYYGNVHYLNDSLMEKSCCLPLFQAFESLLRNNYKSLL